MHPRGVQLTAAMRMNETLHVQLMHPRGVQQAVINTSANPASRSTHAPAWGATDYRSFCWGSIGRSTHAPAWGATDAVRDPKARIMRSTHAPAWGATVLLKSPR